MLVGLRNREAAIGEEGGDGCDDAGSVRAAHGKEEAGEAVMRTSPPRIDHCACQPRDQDDGCNLPPRKSSTPGGYKLID